MLLTTEEELLVLSPSSVENLTLKLIHKPNFNDFISPDSERTNKIRQKFPGLAETCKRAESRFVLTVASTAKNIDWT